MNFFHLGKTFGGQFNYMYSAGFGCSCPLVFNLIAGYVRTFRDHVTQYANFITVPNRILMIMKKTFIFLFVLCTLSILTRFEQYQHSASRQHQQLKTWFSGNTIRLTTTWIWESKCPNNSPSRDQKHK